MKTGFSDKKCSDKKCNLFTAVANGTARIVANNGSVVSASSSATSTSNSSYADAYKKALADK